MGWLKNDLWFWEMFNKHTVVVGNIYSMYTKMGVTLPVLKNEIKDFFFARLGTGGNYNPTLLLGRRAMMDKFIYCKSFIRINY